MSTESAIELDSCTHFNGFYPQSGGVILCSREDYLRYGQYPDEKPVWFKHCPECGKQLVDDLSENLMPFVRQPFAR